MQLDKGDPAIRDRVIFKVLSLIEAGLGTPTFHEKTLRDWFDKNHAKYDQPPTYSFQEAVVPSDTSEEALPAFVAGLNQRHAAERCPGWSARAQGSAARQSRAGLWRGVRQIARSVPNEGVAHSEEQRRDARGSPRLALRQLCRRTSTKSVVPCCRTGSTRRWLSSVRPPCSRWRRGTRSK